MKYNYFLLLIPSMFFFQCGKKANLEKDTVRFSELDSIVNAIESELAPLEQEVGNIADYATYLFEQQDKYAAQADREKFSKTPAGVTYNPNPGPMESSVYISILATNKEESINEAYFTERLDSVFHLAVNENRVVSQAFYNSKSQLSRVFPPYPMVAMMEPDLDVSSFNFYYLADEVRNPDKGAKWIEEVYNDPMGRGWVLSLIHPVYYHDTLQGVLGLDITVNDLVGTFLDKSPKNLLIVDENGTIVAGKAKAIEALNMPPLKNNTYFQTVSSNYYPVEDFNLFKSKNKEVRRMVSKFILEKDSQFDLTLDGRERKVFCKRIQLVNWYLIDIDSL